ncbi:PRC-barrel domain-containing protein [Candidatus Woesearchaeota archaeon]|nr:PRC-barrel domain-containing protein [Candidatus Woesearchaeota archaeon]
MKKKEPFIISPGFKQVDKAKTARDYLGKKVYSTSGDRVGRVKDVVYSQDRIAGLIVRGRKMLFVHKDYVQPEIVDAIILTIDPVNMLKGKLVFDSDGRKIGKVKDIERSTTANDCDNLVVKKHLFAKPRKVSYDDVSVSKRNIILSKAYGK